MSASKPPFSVSEELAKLRHEKKNGQMLRLPSDTTIRKRPIIHAPVASQYAGAKVPKVVYVSSKTPFMSTVKRVKKLLLHVEKRATKDVGMIRKGDREGMKMLAEASEKVAKDREEVLVKASGRAMAKAVSVGEWFTNKERDMFCNVEVRSGTVSVVDDIVEAELELDDTEDEQEDNVEPVAMEESTTVLEGGDTTMELLGNTTKTTTPPTASKPADADREHSGSSNDRSNAKKGRRGRKRKRPTHDPEDLPESRLRWIKTVEVAISLRG